MSKRGLRLMFWLGIVRHLVFKDLLMFLRKSIVAILKNQKYFKPVICRKFNRKGRKSLMSR
jgi:hypothetical protein